MFPKQAHIKFTARPLDRHPRHARPWAPVSVGGSWLLLSFPAVLCDRFSTTTCLPEGDSAAALKVAGEIGKMVAKMHDAQVGHLGLTLVFFPAAAVAERFWFCALQLLHSSKYRAPSSVGRIVVLGCECPPV